MQFPYKNFFTSTGLIFILAYNSSAQPAEEIIRRVREKLDQVNDYTATGKMRTNVIFIKAPVASVKIYYKKPDRIKIDNETGISFIPKGSANIHLSSLFAQTGDYDILDAGRENGTDLRIVKLLPRNENTDLVLSTVYIDEKKALIRKAKITTRESGTFELEMTYGKYAGYGLADKVVFTFNTKEYKLPKGVTFDYDDGSGKKSSKENMKNKKGKIEIIYTSYSINTGFPDSFLN